MKKKLLYIALCATGVLAGTTSCSDYLDTSSRSTVDAGFVFSNMTTAHAAMDGAYEEFRGFLNSGVFGDGLFYSNDIAGSDIERHPEPFKNQPGRHYPETFYQNGTYTSQYGLLSYLKEDGIYADAFTVISKANAVISGIEQTDEFKAFDTQKEPSPLSQLYGEAVALKASAYRELLKNWGDVPYAAKYGEVPEKLASRDSIYDVTLAQLQKVEPLMYDLGSAPYYDKSAKNYFSKQYVDGLIGRMALEAGGYQTRRHDITPVDGEGNVLSIVALPGSKDNDDATYGRRADWQKFYELAKTYFKKVIDNPGTAKFDASEGGFATFFNQMHESDATYADESIFESPVQQGGGNAPRPYSLGRPSNGGSKNAYPCKSYSQGRINPAFYYGMFDPNDERRDLACTVTGSTGKGIETLIPFKPNSKASGGGISCNKWDENRQKTVWTKNQRKSGINLPYMRLSEMYLGYAEACAATGDDADAKTYLEKIRNRAFPAGKANTDEFIRKEGSVLEAVIDERGFEFAGEGDRRFTLIRTGLIGKKVKAIKELTAKMIDGLKTNGYYTFDNGETISEYVWTKLVDGKSLIGHRLISAAPAGADDGSDAYAIQHPGWRGQNNDWESYGLKYGTSTPKTNLAIRGLYKHIDPNGAEAKQLEAEGYKKVNWGIDIVNNADEYYKYLFYDYDYVSAPIYFWPFTPNTITNGGFTNGYGFKNN